jgi:hypothetical protein
MVEPTSEGELQRQRWMVGKMFKSILFRSQAVSLLCFYEQPSSNKEPALN